MNGHVYDPLTAMFFSPDPQLQAPDNWLNYNRYGYCYGNPFRYTDPSGEFLQYVIGAIVGGVINWVSNGCEFSWRGLSYFGAGALAGVLTVALPGSSTIIAAGLGAVNSAIGQGFNKSGNNFNFSNIDLKQVAFAGIMGGVTSYAGGQVGSAMHLDKLLGGIQSPLLQKVLEGQIAGTTIGSIFGGASALANGTNIADGIWGGMKMGFVSGTISGLGNAVQYSINNKVDLLTGEKIHGHHSDPIFMGGNPAQKLTNMKASDHIQLHRDMNDFLFEQQNDFGDHMRPQSNNSGFEIRKNFSRPQRVEALKSFYDSYKWTYSSARYDFYQNNNLNWRLW